MSLLTADTTKHAASSARREAEVAMATPMAPIFGAPRRPNMNTAFSMMFREKASTFMMVLMVTLPMLRSTAR